MNNHKTQIIELVQKIPHCKVTNYGTIGKQIGISGQMVGWILSAMKQDEWHLCPWHRVVAKNGTIASIKLGVKGMIQRDLLINEGCEINDFQVNMTRHFWNEF